MLLSYIRTLKRLAIASACANFLQAVGISLILEYLIRDLNKVNLSERENFMPLEEVALGFGSAMFAFEGISVVLPVYTRMKNSNSMSGTWGVVNISYAILLILYFCMGLFGYLKFGHRARDSITLNLPPEPIYDAVRAMFAISVFLTYPLQFYVPNEIIWEWAKRNLLKADDPEVSVIRALEVVIPSINMNPEKAPGGNGADDKKPISGAPMVPIAPVKMADGGTSFQDEEARLNRYEYLCRTLLVTLTFLLAISVPKLNLLMDLIGSISGTALSLIIPATIHIAAFWDNTKGASKVAMILVDSLIIIFGLVAGASGSAFSLASIIKSFQ